MEAQLRRNVYASATQIAAISIAAVNSAGIVLPENTTGSLKGYRSAVLRSAIGSSVLVELPLLASRLFAGVEHAQMKTPVPLII